MATQISPANFLSKYIIDGHEIQYFDFKEISEGGPEVATLAIDKNTIGNGGLFGGPPLFFQGKMFVPAFRKSKPAGHFKLCVIDLKDQSLKEIGSDEKLILIKKVDKDKVSFFGEIPNGKLNSVSWQ
jgi:hypothetical protein